MRRWLMAAVCVALIGSAALAATQIEATGKVVSVTLYRGQALVARRVPVDAPAGSVQLRVTGLPESVLGHSVFASAGRGVQVRAVRYRVLAVSKAPKEAVQKLNDQIEAVDKTLRANAEQKKLVRQQQGYLDGLERFVAPTAKLEMSKGVLKADTIEKITDLIFEKREGLSADSLKLVEEERTLKEEQNLLQRKRAELTRSSSKTSREAVVFLDKAGAAAGEITLNYLVSNATWEPTYNLRANGDTKSARIEYSALAHQMSGEDWDDVTLTLSTAAAQMVADGPTLAPMWVTLGRSPSQYGGLGDVQRRYKMSQQELQSNSMAFQRPTTRDGQIDANWRMNEAANAAQKLELTARTSDMFVVQKTTTATTGLSVNYKLEGKVSLSSRQQSQMVEIKKLVLPATFYYEAVPLLSEYVYRYAVLTNNSGVSLLEGRSNVYLGGDFVGSGTVPMVARGQKLTVGFGIDPQLRAWREFVSKSQRTQGGNQSLTFNYRIVLDNYSDKPITVRAVDRIPVTKADIKVTLGELKTPLSKDVEYLRAYRPQGILRWEIEIPAKAAAETAKIVQYSYTLEFDKNQHLSGQQPSQAREKLKQDFYMQLKKGKR